MQHDLACRQNALCVGSLTLRPCEWRHTSDKEKKNASENKQKSGEGKVGSEKRGEDKASHGASKHRAGKDKSSRLSAFCHSPPARELLRDARSSHLLYFVFLPVDWTTAFAQMNIVIRLKILDEVSLAKASFAQASACPPKYPDFQHNRVFSLNKIFRE